MTERYSEPMNKTKSVIVICILLLTTLACNALARPTPTASAEPVPTTIIEVISTPTAGNFVPLTEADVQRVSLEEARVAIESGAAIVIDVRSREAYAAGHIPGAISIQLERFETDPAGIGLDKDQWIITYCT